MHCTPMSTLVHIVQFQDLFSLSFRFLFYFSLRKCQTIRTFWGSFVTKTSFFFYFALLSCSAFIFYLVTAKLYHLTTLLCYSNGFLSLLTLIDNLQNNNNSNQHLKIIHFIPVFIISVIHFSKKQMSHF